MSPMSKVSSSASAGDRLSLGHSALSSSSKLLHSLPSIAAALPSTGDEHPGSAPASSSTSAAAGSSAGLITPDILALATPAPKYVDSQAWHLLATEMVFSIVQSSRHVAKKQHAVRQQLVAAGIAPADPSTETQASAAGEASSQRSRLVSDSTEIDSMVSARLEAIGLHVGSNLAEQLSRERTRFSETLDVLKFVCKELWTTIWDKQVDNLRTNHRGVYVLQDNAFKPLSAMSSSRPHHETAREVKLFLSYSVGIVRGALAQLDVPSVVAAETNQAPQCTFHVKTQRAAAAAAATAGPAPGGPP